MDMSYDIAGNSKYSFMELDGFKSRKLHRIVKKARKKERQYKSKIALLEVLISQIIGELKAMDDNNDYDLHDQLQDLEMKHDDYLNVLISYHELSQDCQEILAERG